MAALSKIYVAATGTITAAGANTEMTCAAIKSGINRYGPISFYNKRDYPMTGTSIPEEALPELNEELKYAGLTSRVKRLLRIMQPALNEVIAEAKISEPVPLFLVGPENLSEITQAVTADILNLIKTQTEIEIDLKSSRYFATGRAGVIEAIELGFKFLESTQAKYVLVGGVDSYLDPALLSVLDSEKRILAENVGDAFAPGEGAAFLLLTQDKSKSKYSVALHRPGFGVEAGHRYCEEPYLGDGLADAFTSSIKNAAIRNINAIYSTVNGESLSIKEFGVASIRNSSSFNADIEHIHPVDCVGDVGAASGALLISIALIDYRQKKIQNPVLISCSSDLANRSAICLSKIV